MGAVVPMHLYQEVSNEEMRLSYCEYCGATGRVFETHHIKSKGSGGNECRANKINLCVECHEKAQQYVIAPWELIVRVAYREKSTVAEVYAAVGLLLPENIEELEKMLKVPRPIFKTLEELISMLVSAEETQTELEFFRGQVMDILVHMGCSVNWIASQIGKSSSYVRQRLITYRAFPEEDERAKDLSWTHHRIAAMATHDGKTPAELLDEAVANQYSTREMLRAIKGLPVCEEEENDETFKKAEKVLDDVKNLIEEGGEAAFWLDRELRKLLGGCEMKKEVA